MYLIRWRAPDGLSRVFGTNPGWARRRMPPERRERRTTRPSPSGRTL